MLSLSLSFSISKKLLTLFGVFSKSKLISRKISSIIFFSSSFSQIELIYSHKATAVLKIIGQLTQK